jgi:hypothetical protein
MAKQSNQRPVQPQSNQRLPAGHFNSNGTSQGKQSGAVRPSPDACNDCKERK